MNRILAVIGTGDDDDRTDRVAHEVGAQIAKAGCTLITGGLGGVMRAASLGAKAQGGLVVGILPSATPEHANEAVDVAIATGIGDSRNAIIANTAAGFIAVGGAFGTLSEIAFALKRSKPIASLGSWEVDPSIYRADDAADAVKWILQHGC